MTLLEKNDRIGGLLRYGIPDFKMEKHHIDRRVEQMRAEGVTFRPGIEVGVTVSVQSLLEEYDAVVMSGGAEEARPLDLPAHNYSGIYLAMEFLPQQNKRNAGDDEDTAAPTGTISAKGKHVVVIGGGDTGSDCVGTSNRQGAVSVTQLEIMPRAPDREDKPLVWPDYPSPAQLFRTSSSQEEGAVRDFAIATKHAIGADGKITALQCVRVEWVAGPDGRMSMREGEGSEFELKADLVLLAMGFTGPPQGRAGRGSGRRAGPARQRQGDGGRLQDLASEGVRLRRHAPRPVAGGLGHPRRPPMRPLGRRIPDGEERPAAVGAGDTHPFAEHVPYLAGAGHGRCVGRSFSYARERRRTPMSSKRRPMICRPIGRPSAS